MVSLTPVENDPFAGAALTSAGSDKGVKLTPVDHDPFAPTDNQSEPVKPEKPGYQRFSEGVGRGFMEAGVGFDQTLNNIGVGKFVPMYDNGKLKLGLPDNSELAGLREQLVQEGKGTGVSGFVGEALGDPKNYLLAPAKFGMAGYGAAQSGFSALFGDTSNKNQTLKDRAQNAVLAAPIGAATGKGMEIGGGYLAKKLGLLDPVEDKFYDWSKSKISAVKEQAKKVGLDITSDKPKEIHQQIQDWFHKTYGDIADHIHEGVSTSSLHELNTNFAISDMWKKANAGAKKLYDTAGTLGAKESVEGGKLLDSLQENINNLKSRVVLEPRLQPTIRRFENLLESVRKPDAPVYTSATGKSYYGDKSLQGTEKEMVTGKWLADLKRAMNKEYVPEPDRKSKDTPFAKLGIDARKSIAQTSPAFQSALGKADSSWGKLQDTFKNDVIKKFWKPEDYDTFKAITKPGEKRINPETRQRVDKLLDKIKTTSELEALKGALPPATYDYLRGAKFNKMMSDAGMDAKAIAKNARMIAKTLGDDVKSINFIDDVTTMVEHMNQRGIDKGLNPVALEKENNLVQRAMRGVTDYVLSAKFPGLKTIISKLPSEGSEVSAAASQKKLTNFANELKPEPRPTQKYVPDIIPKGITKPIAATEGKTIEALDSGEYNPDDLPKVDLPEGPRMQVGQ